MEKKIEPQPVEKPEEFNQANDEQQPEEVDQGEKSIQNAEEFNPEKVKDEEDEPTGGNLGQISHEVA